MTKIWLSTAASFRVPFWHGRSRTAPDNEVLQRRLRPFWPAARNGAQRRARLPAAAARRASAGRRRGARVGLAGRNPRDDRGAAGGAEARTAARTARSESEAIVKRIETTRALTLDGHKVKARAELWRRDGAPLAKTAEDDVDDGVWSDMADLPRYDAPAAQKGIAVRA